MKKAIISVMTVMMIFCLSACGTENNVSGSSDAGSSFQETAVQASDSYEVVSMNRFKKAAAGLGEVQDVSEDFGFDACIVTGENGTNYIYIYLPSEEMADQLLTDSDGDGFMDPSLKLIRSGANYDLYSETYENEESGETTCGYYIRVENMLILATGEQDTEETVKKEADSLFRSLGYKLN